MKFVQIVCQKEYHQGRYGFAGKLFAGPTVYLNHYKLISSEQD